MLRARSARNRLIQQGAKLVMDANDILDDLQILLPENETVTASRRPSTAPLSDEERRVYDAIEATETPIDEIANEIKFAKRHSLFYSPRP